MTASNSMARLISRRAPAAAMRVPFGRKTSAMALPMPQQPTLANDLQLFVSTFIGGLVFMMVYLA